MQNRLISLADAHEDDFRRVVALDVVLPEVNGELIRCEVKFEGLVLFVAVFDLWLFSMWWMLK